MAGVKSLLTLVLIDHVLVGRDVVGSAALRGLLGTLLGPASTTGFASQLYGFANALIYLSIPLGGLFGDLVAGRRASVYAGGLCMIAGLAAMASLHFFLPGLALFAVGTGMLKGNLSTQVGQLFGGDAERRQGYALYLAFLNAGVICGPFVCGAVAAWAGWQYAVAIAAVALAAGLAGYHRFVHLPARKVVPPPPPSAPRADTLASLPLLIGAVLSVYLCYAAYGQVSNIFLVWARAHVALGIGGWNMPVAWLLSLDGLFTIALIFATQAGLRALARRGIEVRPLTQIALGGLACAAGYLLLALASTRGGGALSIGWALGYLLLVDLAIVLVWPSGLALIAGVAPPRLAGFWVGLFYLHGFFANLWVGVGGGWYDRLPPDAFWLIHAAIALAGAALALVTGLPRARPARAPQSPLPLR